jgi:hypothetical protein
MMPRPQRYPPTYKELDIEHEIQDQPFIHAGTCSFDFATVDCSTVVTPSHLNHLRSSHCTTSFHLHDRSNIENMVTTRIVYK